MNAGIGLMLLFIVLTIVVLFGVSLPHIVAKLVGAVFVAGTIMFTIGAFSVQLREDFNGK